MGILREKGLNLVIMSKDFKFDDYLKIMTVNGVEYSYQVFEEFGIKGMKEGQLFKVLTRNNSIVIQRIDN